MYSVVLMVALTGSAEATEYRCCGCTGYVGCVGCYGCAGRHHHRHHRCCGCAAVYTCCAPVVTCCGPYGPGPGPGPGGPAVGVPGVKMGYVAPTRVPATMVVTLPEGARLTVDGYATTSTSGRRVLVTPALDVGYEYVYTLRAEVVQNGQSVAQTRTVTVVPGRTNEVPFNFAEGVASR